MNKRLLLLLSGFLVMSVATGCQDQGVNTQRTVEDDGPFNNMAMEDNTREATTDGATRMEECQSMMMSHLGSADAKYDQRFIDMMIPHHQGAVDMARDAANNAQHPELKAMARKMMESQQKEVEQLRSWRQTWYGGEQEATAQ